MQELLDRIGWSQRFFAEYLGAHPDTVNLWCTGQVDDKALAKRLAMKLLERICRDLGV